MTKYITVKLTEDQWQFITGYLHDYRLAPPNGFEATQDAFVRRLLTKLAQAKS